MATMFLGGLWHGASWNFVVWGLMHGAYLAVHKTILDKFPYLENSKFLKTRSAKIVSILATQYVIFMTWLAFRVEDVEALSYVLYKYVVWDFATSATEQMLSHNRIPIALILGFFVLSYISYKRNIPKILSEVKPAYWIVFLIVIMVLILFLYDANPRDFIYFRF